MIDATLLKRDVLLVPQVVTDGATVTASLDTRGADLVEISVLFNAEETTDANPVTVQLLSSDDTVVTNHVTVTANQSQDLLNARPLYYILDKRNNPNGANERYLRLVVTAGTGTGNDIRVAAEARLYNVEDKPTNTTNLSAETNATVVVI